MKIHIIGTGGVFSQRLSPSFVIDETILIEVPNGISKALINQNENISHISLCMVSHLHADHIWDIPFLILHKYRAKGSKMTIVGPSGIKSFLWHCCKMAYPTLDWENIIQESITQIRELDSNTGFAFFQYHISAIGVEHGREPCFGYSISDKSGKVFAYSGDSVLCQGVSQLAQNADAFFVDANDIYKSHTHMGIDDIKSLKTAFSNTLFYLVHTPDNIESLINKNDSFVIPNDNTIINL